jgi:hypothetical protein
MGQLLSAIDAVCQLFEKGNLGTVFRNWEETLTKYLETRRAPIKERSQKFTKF